MDTNQTDGLPAEQKPDSLVAEAANVPAAVQPLPQAQAAPVSANQLADAMIRSMLTSAGNVAAAAAPFANTAGPKKKSVAPPIQDLSSAAASQPATVVPPTVMALTQSPLMRSADTAGNTPSAKLPFGAVVIPVTARTATAPAPLAFGMKLTPLAGPQTAPTQTAQTPSAPAPQPVQPEPAIPTTAIPAPVEAASEPAAPQAEPEPSRPGTTSSASSGSAADAKAQAVDTKAQKESAGHAEAIPVVTAAAAAAGSGDNANDFNGQFSATFASAASNPAASKFCGPSAPLATESAHAAEPVTPVTLQQPGGPLKEIAVRISPPQSPAVDVHVAERAGQIHVAVRTADGGLQTSLRQDLGTLVNSLERSGYRAEAFAPRDGSPALAAQTNSQNSRQESESGSGERNGNSGDPSQNSGGGQQQQRRNPRASNWIEELENQQ